MRRLAVTVVLALAAPISAHATITAIQVESRPTESPAPTIQPAIETERDADADNRIAERIRGIFAAIKPLHAVEVEVREGVVTLSGSVASTADAQQAGTIASRVAGVVTVDNAIERDLAVDSNLAPTIAAISDKAHNLWRMLPFGQPKA